MQVITGSYSSEKFYFYVTQALATGIGPMPIIILSGFYNLPIKASTPCIC